MYNWWLHDDKIGAVERMFLRGTSDTLESLTWSCVVYSSRKITLNALMRRFEFLAPRLRDWTLDSDPEFALNFQGILSHIRTFRSTYTIATPAMWSKLVNVEHLDTWQWPQSGLSTLDAPRLTSLCLDRRFFPYLLPPEGPLQNLTRLALRSFDTGEERNATPLSLPSFKYLGMQFGVNVLYDGTINAKKLEELTIVDIAGCSRPYISLGRNVKPRSLDLYLHSDSRFSLQSQPPSVWSKMEELHLTVFAGVWEIPSTVTQMLSAEEKIFPLLRCLTMRHTTRGKGIPSQTQKQIWGEELRAIMDGEWRLV